MNFHYLELLPVAVYFIAILLLGLFAKKQPDSEENRVLEEDFILGGRRLTLPVFVATLVSTWYGGILGVGEFTYLYGLANWVVFGVPYYVFAVLFAFFLAPKIRASQLFSIPDQFYKNFGAAGGVLAAIYTFFMTLPAPYLLMVGLLLHFIFGWSLWVSIIVGAFFSMIYVLTRGFQAVVRTNELQFILMYAGFLALLIPLVFEYGGIGFLSAKLPPEHLTWRGGNSPFYILAWFFIASWTFIDPGFHQRCYAARTPQTARNGILASVGFWFIFDFLTTASGLYARALLQEQNIHPPLSFPILGRQYLSPLFSGLFLTGLFATIMSTAVSFSLLSAISIGYDLLKKFYPAPKSSSRYLKTGLAITALVSVLLAILVPSVIDIWFILGNIFIPPMLLPLIACYYPALRPARAWVLANLALSFSVSLLFLLLAIFQSPSLGEIRYPWEMPPMYPGLAVSLALFGIGLLRKRQGRS